MTESTTDGDDYDYDDNNFDSKLIYSRIENSSNFIYYCLLFVDLQF